MKTASAIALQVITRIVLIDLIVQKRSYLYNKKNKNFKISKTTVWEILIKAVQIKQDKEKNKLQ